MPVSYTRCCTAPQNLVVDRVQVGTVWRPQISNDEVGGLASAAAECISCTGTVGRMRRQRLLDFVIVL